MRHHALYYFVWLWCASAPAYSADAGDDAKRNLARVQTMLKQVNAAKNAAEAALAESLSKLAARDAEAIRLTAQVKKLELEAVASSRALEGAARKAEGLGVNLESTRRRAANTDEKLKAAQNSLLETKTALQMTEQRLRETSAKLESTQADLNMASQLNEKLFKAHQSLLRTYQEESLLTRFLRKEPVLGIGGVSAENRMQESLNAARDARLRPLAGDATP